MTNAYTLTDSNTIVPKSIFSVRSSNLARVVNTRRARLLLTDADGNGAAVRIHVRGFVGHSQLAKHCSDCAANASLTQ